MKLILETPTGTRTIQTDIKPEDIGDALRSASHTHCNNVCPNYQNMTITSGKTRIYAQIENYARIDQIKYN